MNKQIAVIFAITISLISTTLFAQSYGINDNIELSTKISPKQEKSDATLSIGAGYAGLTSKGSQPNGFDVQTDLVFPVKSYLAINASVNFAQFPKYQTQSANIRYDHGALFYLALSPGISFGNFRKSDKFNYFVTTGFIIGFTGSEKTVYTDINTGYILNYGNGTVVPIIAGLMTSGRALYKLSEMYQIFIEPAYYANFGSDSADPYFHINAGISIAL